LNIPNVCVSIFGTVQPGPLSRYVRASLTDADGLLPRFQVLVYPDPPATWENIDRYPDSVAKNKAFEIFQSLDTLDTEGVEVDEDHNVPFLRFDAEAQQLFDEWRTDLENRLRSGQLSTLLQEHLGKYRSLMPSLALIFHLVEVAGQTKPISPVSLEAAERAAAWCDWLEAHARRVYQACLDGDPEAPKHLGDHLKKSLPNPFRLRDVHRKGWAGLSTPHEAEQALEVLEDRNWVQAREVPAGSGGGRPTVEYWIHPDLLKQE
jgi:hypothetical protein